MATDSHSKNGYARVVITGIGAVTPLALTMRDTWSGLLEGRSGINTIQKFDTSQLRCKYAGEVKGFDPTNYMDRKEARRLDVFIQYAMVATQEAVADAGIDFSKENPTSCGVVASSAIGGVWSFDDGYETMRNKGLGRINPFLVPNLLVDAVTGRLAIEYGLRGINQAITSACATGTSASGEAYEIIRRGDADVLITGGAEAAVTPMFVSAFDIMGALSVTSTDPAASCRPFDRDRDGFVMSEGAAILIMESEEHALARGAKIYAEVIGFGSSNDAHHMAQPHPEGQGAMDAMRMALRKAERNGVKSDEIDYINAHGTATRLNDKIETNAIKQVLGEHAYNIKISSTKSMLGHMLGGAGAIEAAICAKAIENGIVPPTINLHNPDPECDLYYVPNQAEATTVKVAMSNSFGFGGHNACIVLRKYE
ncbi:MAG: beta-ketoacyl-ACP synthase II [Caldilineaceae bacterium]